MLRPNKSVIKLKWMSSFWIYRPTGSIRQQRQFTSEALSKLENMKEAEACELHTFTALESNVRSYARSFPALFVKASGSHVYDSHNNEYIDFLAGAGSLNYGHNNPILKKKLIEYIDADGITQALDMHTQAKKAFLTSFENHILLPRGLTDYKLQFTGPTGTNAVEAALKLAVREFKWDLYKIFMCSQRIATGRSSIVAFTNGYHGVSVGSLAATGNKFHRKAAGISLDSVIRMPYCDYMHPDAWLSSLDYMDKVFGDPSSGVELPAAMILECIQGEGGLNVAHDEWLRGLQGICKKHGILLIVDDIQAGCGRSGNFFSFESSGINPDIITLSKSIGGYGTPMSLVLIKSRFDVWKPGEHNGTFRGNNHAFITAAEAIDHYWKDNKFEVDIQRKSSMIHQALTNIVKSSGQFEKVKGRGMMLGLTCIKPENSKKVAKACFSKGLIIETCGPKSEVLKCFPPLVINDETLQKGLDILAEACLELNK